jgi:hypothetical protein
MATRLTTTNDARTVLKNHEDGAARWQVALRTPPAALGQSVRQLVGYTEETLGAQSRLEVPRPWVVVILELGPPIRVHDPHDHAKSVRYSGGFVAGLDERVTLTSHDGYQAGIELNLCPVAARRVFDTPMSNVSGQVIALDDLLPRRHRGITGRLAELPDWNARLEVVEAMLGERLTTPEAPARIVSWACRRIRREPGLDQKSLAKELGYSQKHVITLLRTEAIRTRGALRPTGAVPACGRVRAVGRAGASIRLVRPGASGRRSSSLFGRHSVASQRRFGTSERHGGDVFPERAAFRTVVLTHGAAHDCRAGNVPSGTHPPSLRPIA